MPIKSALILAPALNRIIRLLGLASVALATLLLLGCEEVLEQPAPQTEASSTAPAQQTPDPPTDTAPAQTPDPPTDTAPAQTPDSPTDTAPAQTPDPPTDTAPAQPPDSPTDTAPAQPPDSPTDTAPAQTPDSPTDTAPAQTPDSSTDTAPAQTPDSPTDTAPAQTSDSPSPTISWLTDAQLEPLVDLPCTPSGTWSTERLGDICGCASDGGEATRWAMVIVQVQVNRLPLCAWPSRMIGRLPRPLGE